MANFTLKEARELLPEVKEITDHYYRRVSELKQQYDETEADRPRRDLIQQINFTFNRWVKEISSLGVEAKGPWLVDFDSGDGIYYCWKYGEEQLEYFHRYETGFKGRRPIERLKSTEDDT